MSYNELISTAFGFFAPFVIALIIGTAVAIVSGYFVWVHDTLKIADTSAWWGFWLFVAVSIMAIVVLVRVFAKF